LTTARGYKQAYSHEVAKDIILEGRGKHFDPDMVDAFLHNEDRFIAIREQLSCSEAELAAQQAASALAVAN
jgi:putative two-component system response regulator